MESISFSSRSSQRSKSVDEILAQAEAFLKQKIEVKKHTEPIRTRLYYEFLSPAVASPISVSNLYLTDGINYPPKELIKNYLGDFIIIHGHPVGVGCAAPTFCHVLGYLPTGEEHPSFIKLFYKKWPMLDEGKQNRNTGTGHPQRLF